MQPIQKKILSVILLSCIVGFCVQPIQAIFKKARSNFLLAQTQQWDFDQIQENYHFIFKVSDEAQKIIPPDEKINVSFKNDSIQWITARYALYPHEIDSQADYNLVFPGQSSMPGQGATLYRLSAGALLFTTATPPPKTSPQKETSTRGTALFPVSVFLISLFLNGVIGYLFLKILRINAREGGRMWFLGTSCLAGNILHSISLWGLLLFSIPLKMELLFGIWISWLIIFTLLISFSHRRPDHNVPQRGREEEEKRKPHFWVASLGPILIITAIFILIALTPLSDWDGLSKWVLKAKVLFLKQALDFRYTHHNYYPLLWPLAMASQFVLLGKVVDMAAQWMSAVYFLLCMTQIWGGLKILEIPRQQRYYVLLVFLPVFFSYRIMASANAENIFLAITAATVTVLTAWIKAPATKSYGRLACFLFIALCLVKFEGAVTVLILLAGIILTQKKTFFQKDNFPILLGGLGSFLLPALWIRWTQAHGYMNTIVHFQMNGLFPNILFLIKENGYRFFSSPLATLLVILFLFSKLHPNERTWVPAEKWHLWAWGGLFLFSVFGNAGQVYAEIQHTGQDAFIRLLLHTLPSLTLLISSRMFVRTRDIE